MRHYLTEDRSTLPANHAEDATDIAELDAFEPDVVFAEHGIMVGDDQWRLPVDWLDGFMHRGGCLIIEGLNVGVLNNGAIARHADLWSLARAWPQRSSLRDPIHDVPEIIDQRRSLSYERRVLCRPSNMLIESWCRPIYEGVNEVAVDSPVALDCDTPIASAEPTADLVVADRFVDRGWPFPWASAHRIGTGYLSLIAGTVAVDDMIDESPDNLLWLQRLTAFLHDESLAERRVRSTGHPARGDVEYEGATEEDYRVEWKSGLNDPRVQDQVVKALAGFANAEGGELVLGIADDGTVLGLDDPVASTPKGRDGFKRRILDLAEGRVGPYLAGLLRINFVGAPEDRTVCRVRVDPAREPQWLRRDDVLPVRIDGKTQSLTGRAASDHVQRRFPGR